MYAVALTCRRSSRRPAAVLSAIGDTTSMNWSPTLNSAFVQTELGHAGVPETDTEPEVGAEAIDRRIEVTGGDDNLAEADHGMHGRDRLARSHRWAAVGSKTCLR